MTRYNRIRWTEYNRRSGDQIQQNLPGMRAEEAGMEMGDSFSDATPMRELFDIAASHTRIMTARYIAFPRSHSPYL